jgi:predicted RNA methylase
LSARLCFRYHRDAKGVLGVIDGIVTTSEAKERGPVATFAKLCFEALAGTTTEPLQAFLPILQRLIARSSDISPGKPAWLVEAEVILHLRERLLGQSRQRDAASPDAQATLVHRTRRHGCGTYSTPNYVVDRLCAAVFSELGRCSRGSRRPLRVVDLSAEAGHFALSAAVAPRENPVEFVACDRDPEAIALLDTIFDYTSRRVSQLGFQINSQVCNSISPDSLTSYLGSTDAVIGNPPWKTMHRTDERAYVERYPEYLQGRFDTYQAFLLRSDEFIRPGGILAVVLPSSILYTDNAQKVRRYLREKYIPVRLETYPRSTIVELQSIAPIAILLKKRQPGVSSKRKLKVATYRSLEDYAKPIRRALINTTTSWNGDGRAVFSVGTIGAERFVIRDKVQTIRLSEIGFFSSGAKLSPTRRAQTVVDFHGVGAKAVSPFFVDRSACKHYHEGARAFDRTPRTDLVQRSKVVFQTIRCISMSRRLVAASAGSGELACSTAAMLVPNNPKDTAFLTGLINASFLNAWYKALDHHHTIKISVLSELRVPQDELLWREIGHTATLLAKVQRASRTGGATCRRGSPDIPAEKANRSLHENISVLNELVFDLYRVPRRSRAELKEFSAAPFF